MNGAKHSSVLVTGGCGFVGRATGKLLQDESYRVVSLDVASSEDGHNFRCDLANREALHRMFEEERVAAIIHLAAILPTAAQRDPVRATQVNILGSLNLLEMAQEFGVKRFVFGSSLSVYGTCPADEIVSEDSRAAPEDVYGASKIYVEQLGAAYRDQFGLEFVSLRIGRVVGPGAQSATSAWRSEIFEFLDTAEKSAITVPYASRERVLLVHVDDVARALVALLRANCPAHGIYNAPCESVIVGDLKREIESVNSNITVTLSGNLARGNPRLVDWSCFRTEFGFDGVPLFERLKRKATGPS